MWIHPSFFFIHKMNCVMLVVGWLNWYRDGTFQRSYRETLIGSTIAVAEIVQLYFERYHVLPDGKNYRNYIQNFVWPIHVMQNTSKNARDLTDYFVTRWKSLFNFNGSLPVLHEMIDCISNPLFWITSLSHQWNASVVIPLNCIFEPKAEYQLRVATSFYNSNLEISKILV